MKFLDYTQIHEIVYFEKFYAFDSTTIRLFSDVLKGVARNHKDDDKKKGGLKEEHIHLKYTLAIETKFSIAFFLFRKRKWYKNSSLGNFDRTFITNSSKTKIKVKKNILNSSCTDKYTL